MANKRTPQTLKKRQRERDKQMKQQEKLAKRLDRSTQKRQAKQDGTDGDGVGYATGVVSDNGNPVEAHVPEVAKSQTPAPQSPPAPGPVPITKAS